MPPPKSIPAVERHNEASVYAEGGAWIAAVRNWLLWNRHGADRLTWGSNEPISHPITVKELEEAAAAAVAADRMERQKLALGTGMRGRKTNG